VRGFVGAIGALEDLEPGHPGIDVRIEGVTVRLISITPELYRLSDRNAALAQEISAVAREMGLTADPSVVQNIQVAIDALVRPEVMPSWRAVLGYQERPDSPKEDLIHAPEGRCSGPADGRAAPAAEYDPPRRLDPATTKPRRGCPRRSPPAATS
jgi:4a-hydroxytetrahydrobiopterin dehydratase